MRRRFFSHGHIRTLIGAFGALFNSTYVANFSNEGTKIDKLTHVPIMFCPRSRIYMMDEKIQKQMSKTDLDKYRRYYEVFPRMGFEYKTISYASERQLGKTLNYKHGRQYSKTPAPYDVGFELTVLARDQFTMLQIIEQLTAYFKPNIALEIKHNSFNGQIADVVVNLDGISIDDDYMDLEKTRVVTAVLSITMSTDLWPYVAGADIELGKFVECGGKVDYPIDPNWPGSDDNDEGDEIIERVIVDLHDYEVYDKFWPTNERWTVLADRQINELNPQAPIPADLI